jgi:Ca-activated chloride channel family protein
MNDLLDRLDPGFLAPVWLIAGFFAIIAVLLLEIGAQRRRNQAVRLFAAPHLIATLTASVSTAKRLLKRIFLLVAVGLLFTALARPHLFFEWREESRTGLDILMAVDCSKSMLTEDVKPSRLERAKLAIADFADRLPDNRLGLIAFAGDAFLQCPLTIDHDAFQTAVRELDTDTIPRPGTDIATAIDQAVLACKSQPGNEKFLILVTDGEDLEGHVLDAARTAAQSGLKIYTIGVGTPGGDLIPERDDSGNVTYHHDASGQIVQSKLDETTLRKIADITGGAYLPLGQRGEGLEQIYNQYIASLPRQHLEERREKVRFERFEWPLALAILFLMWEFIVNERAESPTPPASLPSARARPPVRRRPKKNAFATASLIALGLFSPILARPLHAAATDKAESDYKSGKYEDALQNYREATISQPDRNDLQYNRGDAAYKSGEFNEAEEAFRKTLETPDLNLQEQTYYNLGNTQYKHGEGMLKNDSKRTIDLWEKALHSYESALKLKPAADTQHNYEVVKKKLEQLKQQQQQQEKNNQSQPNKKDQSDKDKQQQDQQQQGQGGGQGNQDPSQQPSNSQQQDQPQPSDKDKDKDKEGQQQQQPSIPKNQNEAQQQGRSQEREADQQDPGVKSRQEAEALLDSLKDDERHITARALNRNGEPPPTPSGKDW